MSLSNSQQVSRARCAGWGALALSLGLVLFGGCGQTVEVGIDDALVSNAGSSSGGSGAGGVGGALQLGGVGGTAVGGSGAEAGAAACVPAQCRGKTYQCGDCLDNDGDGLSDAADPDCLGPCDDDELGLSTGLTANQSAACKQDCYFDGDNGSGNDKCEWSHACDPLSLPPNYPPSGEARCKYGANMGVDCAALQTSQAQACLDACLPLVPNGCDCFGCCELPGGSGNYHYIGVGRGSEGCQLDALDDELACPPCTPVPSCFNDCTKCETCVGRLPDPSCKPGGSCPNGQAACGADVPCGFGDYCVTGCCVPAPEPT